MLCANQQMLAQAWPSSRPAPVIVDWLPWNHTFGGNHTSTAAAQRRTCISTAAGGARLRRSRRAT